MDTWIWIVIAIGAAVLIGALAYAAWTTRRTKTLKERFGPEYDRVSEEADSRRDAEAELLERAKRREELEIRPLEPDARERYLIRWEEVQARFVDDPEEAVESADELIQAVMRERGYPIDDFEQRAADLSVDHPEVVGHYRSAHAIATDDDSGEARTEDLRRAMMHYRALFEEVLVAEPDREGVR
jgi:FtsZ-interacting cell division protein ZipA